MRTDKRQIKYVSLMGSLFGGGLAPWDCSMTFPKWSFFFRPHHSFALFERSLNLLGAYFAVTLGTWNRRSTYWITKRRKRDI